MEMPKPGPAHARFERYFVGRWSGPETLQPSPWGPGGTAVGRSVFRTANDGMAFVQEYEEEREGKAYFHGHGVFLIEPDTQDVLWWWYDSFGFPPMSPARGRWDGEVLRFDKTTPNGDARYRYEFSGNTMRFVIENRFPGQNDFSEFMHGDYRREA